MKKLSGILVLFFFCLQLVTLVSFGQSSPESSINNDQKINESFLKIINDKLKSLNEEGQRDKSDPQKDIYYWERKKIWVSFYLEYTDFEYDIQKTNSIVTPYLGVVTFNGIRYQKKGNTVSECLNSEWENVNPSTPTFKYSYQNGKWILKE